MSKSNQTQVLFITRAYSRNAGGMERLSYEMINSVAADPGICASKVTFGGHRFFSPLFAVLSIPKALYLARRCDVVHLGDPVLSITGWLIKRLFNKPVTVTVHGLDITYQSKLYQGYLRNFFDGLDVFLPISQHVARLVRDRGVKGEVRIVSPGIHDQYYDPSIKRSELAKLLGRDLKDTIVLFTVGRLVRRKGHVWFIKNVLSQLPHKYIYAVAGAGREQGLIEQAAAAIGNDRVRVMGRLTDDELKILYNAADIFVQPNIAVDGDVEGFGLVLLEAALCGKKILAADIEGISDAVTNNENGSLLASGAADQWIKAILAAGVPATSSQVRSYTLAKYAWPKITKAYVSEFKRIGLQRAAV